MKPHDKKKHPYMTDSFWVNNKYWDNDNYTKASRKRLDEDFHKPIVDRYKSKGHEV